MRSIGLDGVDRAERGQHEVPGLGGAERQADRLHVGQLADDEHVRVLAQRVPQARLEGGGVLAHLALVDEASLVAVQELDGLLDGEDVAARHRLMRSTSAASVVEMPDPCGPHTSTRPRRWSAHSITSSGRPRSSADGISAGTSRSTAPTLSRCTKAETRKRPLPGMAWDVESSPIVEEPIALALGEHAEHEATDVGPVERVLAGHPPQLTLDADDWRRRRRSGGGRSRRLGRPRSSRAGRAARRRQVATSAESARTRLTAVGPVSGRRRRSRTSGR